MAKFKLGKGKSDAKITPDDLAKNPVWVNDFDEESFDEDHVKPVVGIKTITADVLDCGLVFIGLTVAGTQFTARAGFEFENRKPYLNDILIWHKKKWQLVEDVKGLTFPLLLESPLPISNMKTPRFKLATAKDERADLVK